MIGLWLAGLSLYHKAVESRADRFAEAVSVECAQGAVEVSSDQSRAWQ